MSTKDDKTPETVSSQESSKEKDKTKIRTEPEIDIIIDGGSFEIPEADSIEAELSEQKDKYLRLAAEYDNFRKRSQKEREFVFTDARADTVNEFLPVYDNLLRAVAQETADDAYKKGVEMILGQFEEVMEKFGIIAIPALGETFDPERHNAVMHIEDGDKGESEIVEEFQKGFIMGDKVIRFSMVKVAN